MYNPTYTKTERPTALELLTQKDKETRRQGVGLNKCSDVDLTGKRDLSLNFVPKPEINCNSQLIEERSKKLKAENDASYFSSNPHLYKN